MEEGGCEEEVVGDLEKELLILLKRDEKFEGDFIGFDFNLF